MKASKTAKNKITLGTKEWADSNVNCYIGCSNDCEYCYAKKMAIRFKRKTKDTWKIMEPNLKNIEKGYAKRKGRVMFPTSHDITEKSLDGCLIVLKKLLRAGNLVLITTKPRSRCIERICEEFKNYKNLVQFRFTITSIDNSKLEFWEPGAPNFEERFDALKFAYEMGFKTSVSIEPFLDKDPYILVDLLMPYITESIWIGKMNYIKANNISKYMKEFYDEIRVITTKKKLKKIIDKSQLYDEKILRIKDSIYNYLL